MLGLLMELSEMRLLLFRFEFYEMKLGMILIKSIDLEIFFRGGGG